jgi:hypothetical protein
MLTLRKGFCLLPGAALGVLLQNSLAGQAKKTPDVAPVRASDVRASGVKGAPSSGLPPFLEVISVESTLASIHGLTTMLQVEMKDEALQLRTSNEVAAGLPAWFSKDSQDARDIEQRKYGAKYRSAIEHLFAGFDGDIRFFGGKYSDDFPVRFAIREGSLAVLVTGIVSANVFNTLRTTENVRAAKVVREIIAPQLAVFDQTFGGSGMKFYGMLVTYGSKDLSGQFGMPNVESVIVVVPAEQCKQFAEAKITDTELISAGETYMTDTKLKNGVKRIKVVLE